MIGTAQIWNANARLLTVVVWERPSFFDPFETSDHNDRMYVTRWSRARAV